jgi:hypothetical protein
VSAQAEPLHAAVPCGSAQATQAPPQSRAPLLQVMPQLVPLQVAVPSGSVAHAVQLAPQEPTAVLDTQAAPQVWKAPVQVHWWLVRSQVRFEPAPQSVSTAQPLLHAPLPRSQ